MGADHKRREARKRKFECRDCELSPDANIQSEFKGNYASLKSAGAKQSALPISSKTTVAPKNIAARHSIGVDHSENGGEEGQPAMQTTKRFIVFIGEYTLELCLTSFLTVARKFTVYCNG